MLAKFFRLVAEDCKTIFTRQACFDSRNEDQNQNILRTKRFFSSIKVNVHFYVHEQKMHNIGGEMEKEFLHDL